MPSHFEDMAQYGAELLLEVHGERDGGGELLPHVITLPGGVLILWPASVGELGQEEFSERGVFESKESCLLVGLTSDLPPGYVPFAKNTTVFIEKYGAPAFNVHALQSRYGGPMTTLSLVRSPLLRLGDNRKSSTG
jgi:hypothetical protein